MDCKFVYVLLKSAKRLEDSLMAFWHLTKFNDSSHSPRYKIKKRRAYIIRNDPVGPEREEEMDEEISASEQEWEVHAACSSMHWTDRKTKARWPEGKTINRHTFARNNTVTSHRPPPGPCYVCTSPLHYARDCPLFGKWETLCKVLIIQVDIDQLIIDIHDQQYLAMLVKSKPESSAYAQKREREETKGISKEVSLVCT
jgi:hypothetical protein